MYLFVRLQGSWFLVSQFSYFCDKFIYYKLWIESTGTAHVCKKQASHPKSRVSSCVEKTQLPISITQILVRSAFQPIIQLRTSEKESGSLVFLVLLLLLGLCLLEVALCTPRTCREKHNPQIDALCCAKRGIGSQFSNWWVRVNMTPSQESYAMSFAISQDQDAESWTRSAQCECTWKPCSGLVVVELITGM